MSEKRKPVYIILLRNQGKEKSNKIEIFNASDFGYKRTGHKTYRYRLRVNGRWWPKGKKEFFRKNEIKEIMFRSMHF